MGRSSPSLIQWLRNKKYQYEVTMPIYVMTPGEQIVFNTFVLAFLSLIIIATTMYLPSTLKAMYNRIWFYYSGDDLTAQLVNFQGTAVAGARAITRVVTTEMRSLSETFKTSIAAQTRAEIVNEQ